MRAAAAVLLSYFNESNEFISCGNNVYYARFYDRVGAARCGFVSQKTLQDDSFAFKQAVKRKTRVCGLTWFVNKYLSS